jgi:hypothetical protein
VGPDWQVRAIGDLSKTSQAALSSAEEKTKKNKTKQKEQQHTLSEYI